MARNIDMGLKTAQAVWDKLNAIAPLPAKGVVAGQAVCSAVMEVLGLGTGVYNDIDVFLETSPEKELELKSAKHLREESIRLGLPVAALDEYCGLGMAEYCFKILGATTDSALNYVWCQFRERALTPSHIVYSFDLNAVEVALDLETRQLTWSRAFEFFLNTQELQVTSLGTPYRTLLRYFKKRDELKCYGNDQFVVDLVASWVEFSKPAIQPVLTKKFRELALQYAPKMASTFTVDADGSNLSMVESWVYLDGAEDVFSKAAGELNDVDSLCRLVPRMLYAHHLRQPENAKLALSAALKAALHRANVTVEKSESSVSDDTFYSVVHMSLELLGYEYLADHQTPKHFSLIDEELAKHGNLCSALFGLTLDEQYHCLRDLRKRAKKDGNSIYGLVESSALPLDMWNQTHRDMFFERIEKEEVQTELASPLLRSMEFNGYFIRELLTVRALKIEGKEMAHCVGGYSNAVCSGNSRILALSCGASRELRSTVELKVDSVNKSISIRQHRGIANRIASAKNVKVLKEYLEEECRRLGFEFLDTRRSPFIQNIDQLI